VVRAYRAAQRQLDGAGLHGYAAAAAWRAAQLGEAPGEETRACAAAVAAQGVRDPARFFAHLLGA
jgi:hypothetical protein